MEYKIIHLIVDRLHSYKFRVRKNIKCNELFNKRGYPSQKLLDSLPRYLKLSFNYDKLKYADLEVLNMNKLDILDI